MSRQIDLTKPLSDEDRAYLLSRDRHAEVRQNDALFASGERQEAALASMTPIDGGNTGDVDPYTRDDGSDTVAYTQHGERATTVAQNLRSQALAAGESDLEYDVEGQRELQESAVAPGPPRVLNPDGSEAEIPQPQSTETPDTPATAERAGDDGSDDGVDKTAELGANVLSGATSQEEAQAELAARGDQTGDQYDDMDKEELRDEAEARGLPKSGSMADLRARLRASDQS